MTWWRTGSKVTLIYQQACHTLFCLTFCHMLCAVMWCPVRGEAALERQELMHSPPEATDGWQQLSGMEPHTCCGCQRMQEGAACSGSSDEPLDTVTALQGATGMLPAASPSTAYSCGVFTRPAGWLPARLA
jgi:hypothetical protein